MQSIYKVRFLLAKDEKRRVKAKQEVGGDEAQLSAETVGACNRNLSLRRLEFPNRMVGLSVALGGACRWLLKLFHRLPRKQSDRLFAVFWEGANVSVRNSKVSTGIKPIKPKTPTQNRCRKGAKAAGFVPSSLRFVDHLLRFETRGPVTTPRVFQVALS